MRPPKGIGGGASDITVWDTHYIPPSKAFSVYRDALCSVYLPWSAKTDSAPDFQGRFETAAVQSGTISRSRCSPMVCIRTQAEVSHSDDECFYVLYVLSGYHACEQRGRRNSAGPGEIIIVDSGQPCRVETGGPYDIICVTVPKAELRGIKNLEDKLANTVVRSGPLAIPLLGCARFAAKHLTTASHAELAALYDAWVSLLPLAGGCFEDETKEKLGASQNNSLLRSLQEFANRNVADPELSAHKAATHCGISVRYVHKLFACSGTTFNAYVAAARLDNVRSDLLSPALDRRQISELAYRWGFSDLSTFNRSFKRRFGCAPTQCRTRGD
jgi:AraC-like DNA-binding protein/mannose-6-phosphate isomerase-like protein (cupin superfamily)